MLAVHFNDWRKNLTKKDKERMHEINIFELIFSRKVTELGMTIEGYELVKVFCLGNERSPYSLTQQPEINRIQIKAPYNFQAFFSLESTEAKFEEFKRLIHLYVVPVLLEFSLLSKSEVLELVSLALDQIPSQNYEVVFLAGKTPKKSPSRKKVALLKGVHRVEGFQLYCEVYDARGMQIVNKLLAEEVAVEQVYSRFLGELKWQSESLIVVKSPYSSWQATIEV
ncbi:hypothetical protein ACQKDD_15275 [Planococcus kocurii]|uniref:hypothetical protein n=1 Tax=Planococcus kocurii TaxID=1374 RepID=UPI003D084E9D